MRWPRAKRLPPGEDEHSTSMGTPACEERGIPVGIYPGLLPNPHILYGQEDLVNAPVTFARYNMARGVHDVQLSNGWQRTNYGNRTVYASSGYLNEVMPEIPGQSRLSGVNTSDFVMRGPAPAQWQAIVDNVQSQPSNPGGPGQLMGPIAKGSGLGARG